MTGNFELRTNDLELTEEERVAADAIAFRFHADLVSLYRTSDGLRAFVVDAGGAEHLGVTVMRAD